jgi:hypothetical protein
MSSSKRVHLYRQRLRDTVTLLQKEQSNLALLRISHHVRLTPHRTACTVCFFVHPLETAVLAT